VKIVKIVEIVSARSYVYIRSWMIYIGGNPSEVEPRETRKAAAAQALMR
jgi:hypothetical protein